MITHTQLQDMLAAQLSTNNAINGCWMDAGYPFDRAIAIQCSAAVTPTGWAWKQYRESESAVAALTNIWRCVMSRHLTLAKGNVREAAEAIAIGLTDPPQVFFDFKPYTFSEMSAVSQVELLAALSLAHRVYLPLLVSIMDACLVQWSDIEQRIRMSSLNEQAFPIAFASKAVSTLLAA
ncbi:hypothetical protein [Ralstonia sp. ASV6]|uniref:hypothetical protein n=1 Tax=Ralstonia sp. ASV6 TaxID=2795124 RepID=UPI0018ED7CD6|nr:hypothetical protein [Ralstonia sp. ASV6]